MLGRSISLNALGQGLSLSIGFVSSILLARVLGPSDRGLLALMLSVAEVAGVVVGVGIPIATTYYAGRRDIQRGALLGNSIAYPLLLACVLVPVAVLVYQPLADLVAKGEGGGDWILVAALIPLTLMEWSLINQLIGGLQFGRYNVLVISSAATNLLGVVVLVGVLELGITGALVATGTAGMVSIVGAFSGLKSGVRLSVDLALFRRVIRYGSRVQVGAVFQLTIARIDLLIAQAFVSLRQVGYYAVAQVLAELPMALALAFRTSVLPLVSQTTGADRDATTKASLRNFALIAGVALVVNAFLAVGIIVVAYGAAFKPAIAPTLILLPGVWFLGLGVVIAADIQGRGRPGLSSRLAGIGAVATVGFDLALIPWLGVNGAALASVFAYGVFGVASLVALRSLSGIAIREMLTPTRADLGIYLTFARRFLKRPTRER